MAAFPQVMNMMNSFVLTRWLSLSNLGFFLSLNRKLESQLIKHLSALEIYVYNLFVSLVSAIFIWSQEIVLIAWSGLILTGWFFQEADAHMDCGSPKKMLWTS